MGAPRSHEPTFRWERRLDPSIARSLTTEARPDRMLRIIHTADVHLGARHDDLGEQASAQRERQFTAFVATVDLAIAEKADLLVVAGDLFDSNVQPRRSVERVAAQLKRLAAAKIRTVIVPGTHDAYDRASIYRAHDLKGLAGSARDDDWVTVLTPATPSVHLATCDALVHGPVFPTKKAPHSPLRDIPAAVSAGRGTAKWQIGVIHGSVSIPGKTDRDDVVITTEEIAGSGLDYLALGHWHSAQKSRAGGVAYAYAGAPEPVALNQDRAGKVLLVTLDETPSGRTVNVEERVVGKTRFDKLELDAAGVTSQPALIESLRRKGDPDLVLDVRIVGIRPDELDLQLDEIEAALAPAFLKVRIRDLSTPALTEGALPSPDTIAGAFIRDMEARIAELEATHAGDGASAASVAEAAELRDALRLGRLLLAGHEVSL
jgi:DNA repair protein SbcD/Mre11